MIRRCSAKISTRQKTLWRMSTGSTKEDQTMPDTQKHQVVVVGAGFAGLQCVHKLRHPAVSITLIDRRNHHLFQPLLYQVATTVLSTSEIAWPSRGEIGRDNMAQNRIATRRF
jgi:hypothetical protein